MIVCQRCERSVQSKIDALIHGCIEDGELRTGIVCRTKMECRPKWSQVFKDLDWCKGVANSRFLSKARKCTVNIDNVFSLVIYKNMQLKKLHD